MDHLVNPELIALAQQALGLNKLAFVPAQGAGGDAGGANPGGPGGAPPPGAPPPTQSPPPASDPGGGFPLPPSTGGGSDPVLQQVLQKLDAMAAGGGAGGAGGPIKPKIDVNVELMQIKNLLAKVCDMLGIHVPAQDMVATPEKLTAMAQGQQTTQPGGQAGAIPPVQPMEGVQPAGQPGAQKTGAHNNGVAFDTRPFMDHYNRAGAIAAIQERRFGRSVRN